jgi:hypothetical protein
MSEAVIRRRAWPVRLYFSFARLEDGVLMRTIFFVMLAGASGFLLLDYQTLVQVEPAALSTPIRPILPSVERPELDPDSPGFRPGERVVTDEAVLAQDLVIDLLPGGMLVLRGTITEGSAEQVAAELAVRGEYVNTVLLDSPGGAVGEALRIGELIRRAGYATQVDDGGLCASSCPLVFAGGVARVAGIGAVIGVHQIYADTTTPDAFGRTLGAGRAMSDTQVTTAAISRYLQSMEVDIGVWVHALETPPQWLYYFTSEELVELKLATEIAG